MLAAAPRTSRAVQSPLHLHTGKGAAGMSSVPGPRAVLPDSSSHWRYPFAPSIRDRVRSAGDASSDELRRIAQYLCTVVMID